MISEKRQQKKKYVMPLNDKELDASVEMTFPASDPPAVGGTTKLKEGTLVEHSHWANIPKEKLKQSAKGK